MPRASLRVASLEKKIFGVRTSAQRWTNWCQNREMKNREMALGCVKLPQYTMKPFESDKTTAGLHRNGNTSVFADRRCRLPSF